MKTLECQAQVFTFIGLQILVAPSFDFPQEPTVISVNSRQELICTDLSRSLETVYNRTGKTALLIKAKQEEYIHENARFYGVLDDNRSGNRSLLNRSR